MDRKYYIAYGSNMAVDQMEVRCPEAKVVGTAILNGWQLRFKRYATIEPNPNANTPVLVWEISERDEKRLDQYEGYCKTKNISAICSCKRRWYRIF